ncbi:MAG TPA: DUF1223 domain-containing protein [Chthonomonadaceae bacterium]|nr:DUF1223 domain-containing protein [Chthonomonadaceae bacterium]
MIRSTRMACIAGAASLTIAATLIAAGTPRTTARRGAAGRAARTPVLVELYTSEGCSSCPSADRVLADLQRSQPVANALVVPLGEHVDYWNHLGWADPFSSSAFSQRQRGYAEALRLDSVYTPQIVVNGRTEFVGSDRGRAMSAIAAAASAPHAEVELRASDTGSDVRRFDVRVQNLPAVQRGDAAEVMLAITEDGLRSSVARGENAGRRLEHVAVARDLRSIGVASADKPFAASPTVALSPKWRRASLSAVVFVQERASRRVLGVATVPLR